jgi:hypothetical protein
MNQESRKAGNQQKLLCVLFGHKWRKRYASLLGCELPTCDRCQMVQIETNYPKLDVIRLAANGPDYSGVFAVADTEPWWLAVHQIVDQAELETIAGARRMTADANRCIAAVGAGEGCDLIRAKLKEARERALAGYRDDTKAK